MAVSKLRNLRVTDDLWTLASVVAARRQTTVSQVLKAALFDYTEEWATEADRAEAARLVVEGKK